MNIHLDELIDEENRRVEEEYQWFMRNYPDLFTDESEDF